jgi:hypothetical protein
VRRIDRDRPVELAVADAVRLGARTGALDEIPSRGRIFDGERDERVVQAHLEGLHDDR